MDQTVFFYDFFAVTLFRKADKQRDLKDFMAQAWTIRLTVFKWTIWFIRAKRVGTVNVRIPLASTDLPSKEVAISAANYNYNYN